MDHQDRGENVALSTVRLRFRTHFMRSNLALSVFFFSFFTLKLQQKSQNDDGQTQRKTDHHTVGRYGTRLGCHWSAFRKPKPLMRPRECVQRQLLESIRMEPINRVKLIKLLIETKNNNNKKKLQETSLSLLAL